MRRVKYTSKFKRDYKREKKSGHHRSTLDHDLLSIVKSLAANIKLPSGNRDHQLNGVGLSLYPTRIIGVSSLTPALLRLSRYSLS
jgi:mRNA-degrading endonuclease YafQ of YafQ-DinJ toxin-antitoxin module